MAEVTIRELRAQDEQAVREFVIKEFFPIEPMCKAVRLDAVQDGAVWCDAVFPKVFNDGLSIVAFEPSTGALIGIRLAAAVHKNEKELLFSKDDPITRNLALFYELAEGLYKDIDIFKKYGAEKLVNFRGLCVAESHQRRGIGTKMVAKSLVLIREKGFSLITAESSGVFSARIFDKLGFERLAELPFDTCVIGGKPLDMTNELKFHKNLILHAKVV